MYRKTVKLFFKIPSVVGAYGILFILCNIFLLRLVGTFVSSREMATATPAFFLTDIGAACFLFFSFFLFIGYEFTRRVRDSEMEEALLSVKRGGTVYLMMWLVLMSAAAFITINIGAYLMAAYYMLEMPRIYLGEILKVLLINVFAVSAGAAGLGVVVSRIRKRIPAYAVLLFLIILTIPTTRDVLSQWWEEYGISLFWLRDLFCLIPPDTEAFYDPLYGLPLEGYRMAQGLLWIAASLGICLWKACSGRKIKAAAVVAVGALSLACVFQIEDKGSVNLQYERPDSASAGDVFWYAEHEGEEKAREADFSVARYDMAFELKKELAAQVKMTIRGGEGQSEYPFTLYHGYRVAEVTNGAGEEMDYEQEGDYVTVRGASDGTICLRYRGHSPIFYSNKNACFLPGFFPYYPRAGFRKICDLEWNNGTLYCQEKDEAAEFFVTVEGACGLTTNLAETADGWEGTASDVILLGGFYERDEAGNITYPLFEQSRDIMEDILVREDTLRQAAEARGESAQEKPVILVPTSTALNSYLNGRFESSNYVLVGNAYDYSSVNGEGDSDD